MTGLRVLSVALVTVAVVCMAAAIGGMVTGRQSARTGYLLRLVAVLSFVAAVIANVAAH